MLSISEVARQVGLRPSTIRYYETIGVLAPATRVSGQRRYDSTALQKLAVIQRAQCAGFTLSEIRQLLFGFREGTPASARWTRMSQKKLQELDRLQAEIKSMQDLLRRLQKCRCASLDECGRAMLTNACGKPGQKRSNVRVKLKLL